MENFCDENKYLKQLQHIIDIDQMLHRMEKPTIKELSAKIGLDDRTTRRYLKMMKENFGAPIRSYRNSNRYEYDYSDPNYSFMDITISQEEANALISARQLLQSIPLTSFYEKTLKGLNNLIARAQRYNKVEGLELHDKIVFTTDCTKASSRSDLKSLEAILYEALQKNLPVRFTYTETWEDDSSYEEVYYPLLLSSYHGTWYILAIKNALGPSEKMSYKLPKELTENDFELIHFYDIADAKIIALAKDRELPEIIATHENAFSYCPPAAINYDDDGYPILSFNFWFKDYHITLNYRYNLDTGKIELFQYGPLKMVCKNGEFEIADSIKKNTWTL